MKKFLSLLLIVILSLSLVACGGVSQSEYDQLKADYNALLEEVELSKTADNSAVQSASTNTQTSTSTTVTTPGVFNSEDVASQLEFETYWYTNSIKTTWIALVVKNNSDFDIEVNANITLKSPNGEILGADSKSERAFESKSEIVIMFMSDYEPSSVDCTFSASEIKSYYKCVNSSLSSETTQLNDKIVVATTNNGDLAARFVECTALFFNGDALVGHADTHFGDTDYELKPTKTIVEELKCRNTFDSAQVYFTGYAD